MARGEQAAGGLVVRGLAAGIDLERLGDRIHEALQLLRVDDRRERLVDRLLVVERIAVRGGVRDLLVAGPDVGEDRGVVSRDRHLDLRVAEQVAEPGDGQLLRAGARDDVDVRGEGILETVAGGEQPCSAAATPASERERMNESGARD